MLHESTLAVTLNNILINLGSSGEQSWHGREEDIEDVTSRRTFSKGNRWEPDNTNLIPRQRHDVKSRLGTVGGSDQAWNDNLDQNPGYKNTRWRNQENLDTPNPGGNREQNYRGGRNFGGNLSWQDGASENHRTPTHKTKARERVFKMLNDQNSKNKVTLIIQVTSKTFLSQALMLIPLGVPHIF